MSYDPILIRKGKCSVCGLAHRPVPPLSGPKLIVCPCGHVYHTQPAGFSTNRSKP